MGRGQRLWTCYFSHNINVSISVLLADFTANSKTNNPRIKKGEMDRRRNRKSKNISASKMQPIMWLGEFLNSKSCDVDDGNRT